MKKKILISLMIIIALVECIMPFSTVKGYEIDSANIVKIGTAEYHLKYYNEAKQMYTYIICSIVGYYKDDKFYPAYCMNSDLPGAETVTYDVNINSIIDRDDIWRVVTHGYPYKTAEQMGVYNDFDAFVVTKMAVYCMLGQSQIEKFSYEENDDRAHMMYDALVNLVNIGNDTSIQRKNGIFYIEKQGEILENGEYFEQKYSINQDSNLECYEVKDLVGFPEGTIVADENNNPQNVFECGKMFKILVPRSKLTEAIDGKFNVLVNLKTYPVFYGEAPSGYQNYIVTYGCYEQGEKTAELHIDELKGNIKIIKKDLDSQELLEGVEFELYDQDMNLLETLITNENGEAVSEFYPSIDRVYYLKEIKTKEGYILNDKVTEVTLADNRTLEIILENKKIPEPEPEPIPEPEPEPIPEPEPEIIPEPQKEEVRIILPPPKKLPKTGM